MSFVMASFVFGFAVVSGGMLAYSLCRLVGLLTEFALEKIFGKRRPFD